MNAGLKINCLALVVGLLMVVRTNALIVSGTGSPTETNGWPEGAAAVSDLKSCVGWWEGPPFGGGEWHVQFRGDAKALNQALTNFAAIKSPTLDLVVHDGPKHDQFLELDKQSQPNTNSRVDWELVIWVPESWNQCYNSTNEASQRALRLFVSGDSWLPGGLTRKRLTSEILGRLSDHCQQKISFEDQSPN